MNLLLNAKSGKLSWERFQQVFAINFVFNCFFRASGNYLIVYQCEWLKALTCNFFKIELNLTCAKTRTCANNLPKCL